MIELMSHRQAIHVVRLLGQGLGLGARHASGVDPHVFGHDAVSVLFLRAEATAAFVLAGLHLKRGEQVPGVVDENHHLDEFENLFWFVEFR